MSRPPATDATGAILEDAWEGKIMGLILIPVFQNIFLEMADAYPDTASSAATIADPVAYMYMMAGVLGLFSIGLTITSVVGAYALAREPGLIAYFVFDFLVASILKSSTVAVLLLIVAVPTAVVVVYLYRIWLPTR